MKMQAHAAWEKLGVITAKSALQYAIAGGCASAPTTAVPSPDLAACSSPSVGSPHDADLAWSESGDFCLPDAHCTDDGEAEFALVGFDEIEPVIGNSSPQVAAPPPPPGLESVVPRHGPVPWVASSKVQAPVFTQWPPSIPCGAPDAARVAAMFAAAALAAAANRCGTIPLESAVLPHFPGIWPMWPATPSLPGHAATGDAAAAAAPKPFGVSAEPLSLQLGPEGLMLIPARGWPEEYVAQAEKKQLAASKAKTRFEGGRRPTRGRSRSPALPDMEDIVDRTERGRQQLVLSAW